MRRPQSDDDSASGDDAVRIVGEPGAEGAVRYGFGKERGGQGRHGLEGVRVFVVHVFVHRATEVNDFGDVGYRSFADGDGSVHAEEFSKEEAGAVFRSEGRFFRSYGACALRVYFPTDCAVGCILSPLRGLRCAKKNPELSSGFFGIIFGSITVCCCSILPWPALPLRTRVSAGLSRRLPHL